MGKTGFIIVMFWVFGIAGFASSATTSAPELNVSAEGTNVLLSWPASAWNFELQFRPDLVHPPDWTNVTGVATVSNGVQQFLVPTMGNVGFFRLAQICGSFTNSIGMTMTPVPAGSFTMGYWQDDYLPDSILDVTNYLHPSGDYDEMPPHQVTISQPFWLGTFEVSNQEYEQFDPSHAFLRGKYGFSFDDDEAVVFVSWNDANAFCNWLAAREGLPYRLPTEAEWEYACRAGTTTHFSTGDTLPAEYPNVPGNDPWYPYLGNPVSLERGQTAPNPWGLYDMHGNVEEWCSDWYGPYDASSQTNPVGTADGIARVSRGGSHSTFQYYLRSENRSGALPEDNSWYIGFRVAMGDVSTNPPLPAPPPPAFESNVSQSVPPYLTSGPDPNVPYFFGPVRYVNYPDYLYGPIYSAHNHSPGGIVECPNGDLLAIWGSCVDEYGRETSLAASRMRYGQTNWDDVSLFYDIPDRSDSAPSLGSDGNQTLYFFCGFSTAGTWGPLAVLMRTSTDSGATWTKPAIIIPDHNIGRQPVTGFFQASNGDMILPCDASPDDGSGTFLWISHDHGNTWFNAADGQPPPIFAQGNTGAWIAGIHAAVAQLPNGAFVAFGRGNSINGFMPMSVSTNGGTNWTYSPSLLPPIITSQRATILQLREGPLFLASFSPGFTVTNASGGTRTVSGLFAAVSYDGGITWPYMRLVTDDAPDHTVETMDGVPFTMNSSTAESYGYLSSTQARNGIIHLISSRQHYEFNLQWILTPPP